MGPGLCLSSNRYHPLVSSQPGWGAQPSAPALLPTYLSQGQAQRRRGTSQIGWAPPPPPPPILSASAAKLVPPISLGPRVLFGGHDLPSFLMQGMQEGVCLPSANAIIPSSSTPHPPPPSPQRSPLTVESVTSAFETLVCCETPPNSLPPQPTSCLPQLSPRLKGQEGGMMVVGFCT